MAANQLYQLNSKTQLYPGAYVSISGPWDSYGVVLKSERQQDGVYLNLIRGCAQRADEDVVERF